MASPPPPPPPGPAALGIGVGLVVVVLIGHRRWSRRPRPYSAPRSEKYTSNTVSNARQWALFFTSVAASAYLNASRSSIGMWVTASMASRFSVRLHRQAGGAQLDR